MVTLFAIFLWRGVRTALRTQDMFGRFLAVGITSMIVVQAFINISVVLGLMPTKGIPLPLISYGGSSLFITLACVGVLLNVSKQAMTWKSFLAASSQSVYSHFMRAILAGGGTGGHVIPALAIAQELQKSYGAEILFIGTARGIENRLVPAAGFSLRLIEVGALNRVSLATRLKTIFGLAGSRVSRAQNAFRVSARRGDRRWRIRLRTGDAGSDSEADSDAGI